MRLLIGMLMIGLLMNQTNLSSAAVVGRRPVMLWTLWATDESDLPRHALLRFTSLDACYWASLRHGLTTGETATCLQYRSEDFKGR